MQASMTPWLLTAIPCMGAVLSLLWWSSLHRMKTWALLTAMASLLASMALSWELHESLTGMPFLCLLPLTAFLSLLGQPLHQDNRAAWLSTLVLLGLGLGILTAQELPRHIMIVTLLGIFCGVIYHMERPPP